MKIHNENKAIIKQFNLKSFQKPFSKYYSL